MAATAPDLILTPFAQDGNWTQPPQTSTTNYVNFTTGYTPDYEISLTSGNPSAKAVDRPTQNYLFYQAQLHSQNWQQMSIAPWFAAMPGGYAQNAYVIRMNASGVWTPYRSLVSNNMNDPLTSPTFWEYQPYAYQMLANIPMPQGGPAGSSAALVTTPVDFNTLTSPGTYEVQTDAIAAASSNPPTGVTNTQLAGMLEVMSWMNGAGVTYVVQRYLDHNGNLMVRGAANGVWTTWEALNSGFSSTYSYATSTMLTVAQANAAIQCYGSTAATTFTLPLGAMLAQGVKLRFYNDSLYPLTIAPQGTDTIFSGALFGDVSVMMQPGDTLEIVSLGSGVYNIVGGSAAIQFAMYTQARTPPIGDHSNNIATTEFVAESLTQSVGQISVLQPVRQTVQYGETVAGYANMLSAGIGFTLNLAATAVPMKVTFAAGTLDYIASISADMAGVLTLPPSNLSFLSVDYVSPTSVTWNDTLAQPQYGSSGNVQTPRANLTLNGSVFDDYGNQWTNTNVTFGNTNPAIPNTSYAMFNGTSSYVSTTAFTSLGQGGWSLRGWFKLNALPAAGTIATLLDAENSSSYGTFLSVNSAGETVLYATSASGAWNIASDLTAATASIMAGAWYYVELTFDASAGAYRVYVNGVQVQMVASTAVICPISIMAIGSHQLTTDLLNGMAQDFEFLPYCQHTGGTTYAVPTMAPDVPAPNYAFSYNQAAQSCLQLNNNSLDDFGNIWTNYNVTFGNTTPAIPGTYYGMFNGTTSRMVSTSFASLGQGGWSLRGRFYLNSLSSTQSLVQALNTSLYGVSLGITTSGTFFLYLSSTGTTWNIASDLLSTAAVEAGMWNYIELTFDSVAGVYRLYLNGTQVLTAASAYIINPINYLVIGTDYNENAQWLNGMVQDFEFLPYCEHPAGTTYAVPTAAPNIATPGYAADFFSVPDMNMNQVSAPSTMPGWNPTFEQVNRVYVGEAATNATGYSYATNYALNGKYDSGLFPVLPNMMYSKNHNLGVMPKMSAFAADDVNGTNERDAADTWDNGANTAGWNATITSRISSSFYLGNYTGFGTASATPTQVPYYRILCNRKW
jgi:hypothetical protein